MDFNTSCGISGLAARLRQFCVSSNGSILLCSSKVRPCITAHAQISHWYPKKVLPAWKYILGNCLNALKYVLFPVLLREYSLSSESFGTFQVSLFSGMLPRAFSDPCSLINRTREKAHEVCVPQAFYSSWNELLVLLTFLTACDCDFETPTSPWWTEVLNRSSHVDLQYPFCALWANVAVKF